MIGGIPMNKSAIIPIGGILVIMCFFFPWIRACNMDISGVQLASDKRVGDPVFWIVLVAGIVIFLGYLVFKERSKVSAIISSFAGLAILAWKVIGPLSSGEARQIGMSLQIGGYGTVLGLILSLAGGIVAEYQEMAEDEIPAEKPPGSRPESDQPRSPEPRPSGSTPDFIQRAKAKGLIDQASLLGSRRDEPSLDQARLLWEEALTIGGLDMTDELLCHHSLGSHYLSRRNLDAAIPHLEYVLSRDPNLDFLTQVDDATKQILRAELYVTTSVAYECHARDVIMASKGAEHAALYLQEKMSLLRHRVAPSFFLELGRSLGLAGKQDESIRALRWAVDAPSYGSEFQEDAKMTAAELLHNTGKAAGDEGRLDAPEVPIKTVAPDFGQIVGGRPRKWAKVMLWGGLAVVTVGAALFFALPSPYRKYYNQAKELYADGQYNEALASVELAKAKKKTSELNALEQSIQAKINEQKERERQAALQREYDDYYRRAQNALNNGNYIEAKSYAQLARERIATRQVNSLIARAEGQIQRQRDLEERRQQEENRRQQAAADDAAYQRARNLATDAGYREYLQAYPKGRHINDAQSRMNRFKQQEQAAADDAAYQRARNLATEASYREYLQAYPNGRHAYEAQIGIRRLGQQGVRSGGPRVPGMNEFVHVPTYRGAKPAGYVIVQFQDGYRMLVRDSIRKMTQGVATYLGNRVDRADGVAHVYFHILNTDLQKVI